MKLESANCTHGSLAELAVCIDAEQALQPNDLCAVVAAAECLGLSV